MGWFSSHHEDAENSYRAVHEGKHEGSLTHELLAGAGAFEAMKAYEQRQAAEGNPPSHAFAKELIAGFVGAEIDKLIETKGLNYLDAQKAKRQATEQAHAMYDAQYGNQTY